MSDLEVNSVHCTQISVAKNVQNDKELRNVRYTMHALAEAQPQASGFEESLDQGSDMHVSLYAIEGQSK